MGLFYYAACRKCKEYIFLDKWYFWKPQATIENLLAEIESDLSFFIDEAIEKNWIRLSLRLHWFLGQHNGHPIWIGHENDPFFEMEDDKLRDFWTTYTIIKVSPG